MSSSQLQRYNLHNVKVPKLQIPPTGSQYSFGTPSPSSMSTPPPIGAAYNISSATASSSGSIYELSNVRLANNTTTTTTGIDFNNVLGLKKRLDVAINEREVLENQVKRKLASLKDTSLLKLTRTIPSISKGLNLAKIHNFKAHTRPIRAFAWSKDSDHIVSASDDNNLIVWNAKTKLKEYFEPLQSEDEYVFACDISPDNSLIVSGGLNNHVSVFRINNSSFRSSNTSSSINNKDKVVNTKNLVYGHDAIQLESRLVPSTVCRFKGHSDCVTGTKFVSNLEILSSSNDRRCILWDINKGTKSRMFAEHLSDVTSISLSPTEPNLFLTSSASDSMVRLFDVRASANGGLVEQFGPVGNDATVVEFFPSGKAFAAGTKESAISLFDIRAGSIKLEEYLLPITNYAQQQLNICRSPTSSRFKHPGSPNTGNNNNSATNNADTINIDTSVTAATGYKDFRRVSSISGRHSNSRNSLSRRSSIAAMDIDGVESLSFSNSGRILFCCTQDMGCFAFDVLKGEKTQELDKYSSIAKVSPDGYAVLTACNPNNAMELWTFK